MYTIYTITNIVKFIYIDHMTCKKPKKKIKWIIINTLKWQTLSREFYLSKQISINGFGIRWSLSLSNFFFGGGVILSPTGSATAIFRLSTVVRHFWGDVWHIHTLVVNLQFENVMNWVAKPIFFLQNMYKTMLPDNIPPM